MDDNELVTELAKHKALMKTIVLSTYIICITYLAVHFENTSILWWMLLILFC